MLREAWTLRMPGVLAVMAAAAGSGAGAQEPEVGRPAPTAGPQYAFERVPGRSIAVTDGDRALWRFHHDPARPHTFFHPLSAPGGGPLTRDRPADHPWHHGLWFCWKSVNGVNYWENVRGGDRPAGRTTWKTPVIEAREDLSARIRMSLDYAPGETDPVLAEERLIVVSKPAGDGSFHIDWTGRFTALAESVVLDRTPPPGEPGGKVYGGYAGLSLRLVNLDERRAVTLDGPETFNAANRLRTRSAALEYDGLLKGRAAGVAILDHPLNLNAPSPWYVIRSRGMSFVTPAVICPGPHRLQRGEGFTLRYRIMVHPGRWDRARLAAEARRHANEPPSELDPGKDR